MIDESVYSNLRIEAERDEVRRLVVGAVVVRHHRVLILRRRRSDFLGGRWELPSGVVEPGEALDDALTREIAEETGLRVTEVSDYLGEFDYLSSSGARTRQFTFVAEVATTGPVTLTEHDAHLWTRLTGELPVSDEVREILGRYQQRLREPHSWSAYSLGNGA
ncbi:DNA mismatch repair protein MutT [Nocardia mangyaensis]|uniref:DNA mismatch repair protein MutT n=1 Tax=Nocardia mangyaensis TaxID=2213200 RepID=A0A1J0VWU5_9NOCA|nr:NUDIX domain-containing protein [Nocardia mangyaensis]APE36407.1 DNA mismatch repair protein MutT [Nocardia mangyaensis]